MSAAIQKVRETIVRAVHSHKPRANLRKQFTRLIANQVERELLEVEAFQNSAAGMAYAEIRCLLSSIDNLSKMDPEDLTPYRLDIELSLSQLSKLAREYSNE